MPWQPGESGNLHRGPNKVKRIKAALNRYADSHPEKLDEYAAQLWALALEGKVDAMIALADRMDGKVPQAIVGDDDHPGVKLETVQRTIVDPRPVGHTDSASIQASPNTEPV